MKLTWKNYAYNIFQIVVLLQICSAVRGQVTVSEVTMPSTEDTTNMTSSTNPSISNVTTDETGITNMTSSTNSPISNAMIPVTMTETNTTNMTSWSNSSMSNDTTSPVTVSQGATNSTIMSQGSPTGSPNITVGHQGTSKTSPSSPADNTSTIIIVIVLVAAIIVVIIALITGFCLCSKRDGRQPKGYLSPEMNGKTNGVAKDQPLSDKRLSKEIDTYETVNETDQLDKSSPSVDKPSEKNTNHCVNDGLVTEDENDTVANKIQLAKDSKQKTGNIFDEIDPTADKDGEQIELSPSESPKRASRSEGEGTLERPKSLTGEQADKGRETSVPPTAGLRRDISNRDENLIKLRPTPQPRARPTSRVLQDEDGPAKAPTSSPENSLRDSTGSDPPSPSSQPEKQRLFRPPLIKGKGPDGSDQAALLANVLRKSNTPRQLEEDTDVNKEEGKGEATTYW